MTSMTSLAKGMYKHGRNLPEVNIPDLDIPDVDIPGMSDAMEFLQENQPGLQSVISQAQGMLPQGFNEPPSKMSYDGIFQEPDDIPFPSALSYINRSLYFTARCLIYYLLMGLLGPIISLIVGIVVGLSNFCIVWIMNPISSVVCNCWRQCCGRNSKVRVPGRGQKIRGQEIRGRDGEEDQDEDDEPDE